MVWHIRKKHISHEKGTVISKNYIALHVLNTSKTCVWANYHAVLIRFLITFNVLGFLLDAMNALQEFKFFLILVLRVGFDTELIRFSLIVSIRL